MSLEENVPSTGMFITVGNPVGKGKKLKQLYCICLCCVRPCFKACILGLINGKVQARTCISGTSYDHLTSSQPTFYPICCYSNQFYASIIWQYLNSALWVSGYLSQNLSEATIWDPIKTYTWVEPEVRESQHPMGQPLTNRRWELVNLSSVLKTHNSKVQWHSNLEDISRPMPEKPTTVTNSTVQTGMAFPPSLFYSSQSLTPASWDQFLK